MIHYYDDYDAQRFGELNRTLDQIVWITGGWPIKPNRSNNHEQ